ncbi:MAG TPA: polyprenyl synthetase family protein [Acidimicrobiales bacterium]|nr:polyprenyl synthetase family protein [Acidimicrobiales bacterium]
MNVWELLYLPGLDEGLARVELELHQAVDCPEPLLAEVASYLVNAGGKRLRPAISLASAAATGARATQRVVEGAVSIELVHMGSLYHDDVIDEAGSRRGVESANSRWGNLVAILAGDFLLARASEIAARLGTDVVKVLATTIGKLCQGEMAQLRHAFSTGRTEAAYFESISSKTASLLSASAKIGGIVAGASPAEVEALAQFGHSFGMAFQIWDDVRDLVCTEAELGKPAGHDMLEGTYTLPVIRALADLETGPELAGLLGRPLDGPELDKARDMILASPAIQSSISEGRKWADRAASTVRQMPPPSASSPESESVRGNGARKSVPAVREMLSGLAHRLLDDLALQSSQRALL